jgi:hypothetical protein
MDLDELTDEQKKLWSRVDELWKISMTREAGRVRDALHPKYTGRVTGQARPHDREAAVASVGPSSPHVLSYKLNPLSINVFDDIAGAVHHICVAEVASNSDESKRVSGRFSEVYIRKNGECVMISVSGGPDGER